MLLILVVTKLVLSHSAVKILMTIGTGLAFVVSTRLQIH